MISLSLCMIVKNEEETLGRCLECIKDIVDEIVIVDTGSTDSTKAIALKYTDKIYDFEWCDDFSKARNYSFSKATKEYMMWLDADDVILEKDRAKLKKLKESLDKGTDIVMLKYDLNLDENGVPALSYYRERILKRKNDYKWKSPIHEVIELKGKLLYEDISITHQKEKHHDPKRNLRIFETMKKKNIQFDARQTFYYARELYYNGEYDNALYYFNKFLKDERGFIENKISACLDLYDLYININKEKEAIQALFNSFEYDIPRAEICCSIANYFFNKNKYEIAIYWYKEASEKVLDIYKGGFYIKDCYDFIPYMGMCVCYFKLGDLNKSNEYNKLAGKIKPNDKNYLNNIQFFETKGYK
ncbi:MAG: glycosyltransferase family 2 protein [Clostridia bacterium]|nr:glycosyltransferase family 2 protein [Clostridia bacterium]